MNNLLVLFTLIFIIYHTQICGQSPAKAKSSSILIFGPSFGFQYGIGKHSDRYSSNSRSAMSVSYKSSGNWTVGLEGAFLFGSDVKNRDLFGSITTSGGFIVGRNQSIEKPELEGRGAQMMFEVGKIITISKSNLNSGIHTKVGVDYLFYRSFTTIDLNLVPQLSGDYLSGYDQAKGGFGFHKYIGYTYFGPQKLLNFSIGLESVIAFTQSLRSVDFATGQDISQQSYTTWLIGPKLYLNIPLYLTSKQKLQETFYTN